MDFAEDKLRACLPCDLEALKANLTIWADAESPDKIYEWNQRGWKCYPTRKGPNSVINGIEIVGSIDLTIGEDCPNTEREMKSYSWKRGRDGVTIPEPIKVNDHAMDALSYCLRMEVDNAVDIQTDDNTSGITGYAREYA
jgi:phage terminase large subunit